MLPYIAAILLGLGALGGLTLALFHLRGRRVALWPALLHAAAVLPGVALLFWTVVTHGKIQSRGTEMFAEPHQVLMGVSLLLFLLAAAGGAVMFFMHAKRRRLPVLLIVGHGILAITAYVLLLIALFTRDG